MDSHLTYGKNKEGTLTKKCSSCCVYRTIDNYRSVTTGKEFKTCSKCRDSQNKSRIKRKEDADKEIKKKEDELVYNSARRFIREIFQYRKNNKGDSNNKDWRLNDTIAPRELYEKYDEWRFTNCGEHQTHNKFRRSISELLPDKKRHSSGTVYILKEPAPPEEKLTTTPPAEKFIQELLQYRKEHIEDDDDWRLRKQILGKDLYSKYTDYCQEQNKEKISKIKFGRYISQLLPNKKRSNKGVVYILN